MITTKDIEEFIQMIESFNRSEGYFAYPLIKNALAQLEFPIAKCTIETGRRLIRGRVHANNEDIFHEISDISYRKDLYQIKDFGRANEPCQSIFYCSDTPQTAFFETCTIAREELDKDFEQITWGIWEVTKPFNLTYVISENHEHIKNQEHSRMTNVFHDFLKESPSSTRDAIVRMHNYLSKQFKVKAVGHSTLYKVSAAYSNWVFNQQFADHRDTMRTPRIVGGVMYASSLWPDEGMNLALRPEIVDQNLRLIDVRRDKMVRVGQKSYDGSDTVNARRIDLENGKIEW